MKLYNKQHPLYCGIDLHAKTLHVCVVDQQGEKRLHRNFQCQHADRLFSQLDQFGTDNLVVGCESTFNWYWLADACQTHRIEFILGHALYLKAIHGGKTKSDAIDSEKLARLIRGGNFPLSHVYPKEGRAARDLMRRRTHFIRRRAEALAHIQMVHLQHNRLRTIPGVGRILAMTMMYEIGSIDRFKQVGDFLSFCRLVAGKQTSAGKSYGSPGRKIGNPHLRWSFGEAITLLKRESAQATEYCSRVEWLTW